MKLTCTVLANRTWLVWHWPCCILMSEPGHISSLEAALIVMNIVLVVWLSSLAQSAIVSDKDAATIRNSLLLPKIATIAQWCLIAIGTIVLAITVPYNIRRYVKENEVGIISCMPFLVSCKR